MTGQCEKKSQYFTPIALIFLCGGNRRVASNSALPYRICHFGAITRLTRECKIGEEQQVDKCVYKLFCERVCGFKFLCFFWFFLLPVLSSVKQDLVCNRCLPSLSLSRCPKELLLPCCQTFFLMQIRQDSCEYPDTVQDVSFGSQLRVGKGWVMT